MSKVIAFLPAAGGVGNSMLSANIAGLIANENTKVLLIDLNMGYRSLDLIMTQASDVTSNILDVTTGKISLEKSVTESSLTTSLDVLNASWTKNLDSIEKEDLKKLVLKARENYDYVFFDMPGADSCGYTLTKDLIDTYIIATTLDRTSLRNMDKIAGNIRREDREQDLKLLINKYREDLVRKGTYEALDILKENYNIPLVGVIPTEDLFLVKSNAGELITKEDRSVGARQLQDAGRRITGGEVPFTEIKKKKWRQFFESN